MAGGEAVGVAGRATKQHLGQRQSGWRQRRPPAQPEPQGGGDDQLRQLHHPGGGNRLTESPAGQVLLSQRLEGARHRWVLEAGGRATLHPLSWRGARREPLPRALPPPPPADGGGWGGRARFAAQSKVRRHLPSPPSIPQAGQPFV